MPTTASIRTFLILAAAMALLSGCDPGYPEPSPTGLPQDTDSAAMAGHYHGTGTFSSYGYAIYNQPVNVTVKVNDLGDDYVRITLRIRQDYVGYTPELLVEGVVRQRTCQFHTYDESFRHYANVFRTRDVLAGNLGVTTFNGWAIWFLNDIQAER